MNKGRPPNAEVVGDGKPRVEPWLTKDQKAAAKRIIADGGGVWGAAHTDLITALAVARCSLRDAVKALAKDDDPTTDDAKVRTRAAWRKERETAIGHICSICTKLGLSKTGAVGKKDAAPQAGPDAGQFLTLKPRSKAK